jgi:hypothetical protein
MDESKKETTMTASEFFARFNGWFSRQEPGEWRYGQALFNLLAMERPDIAEKVRGTTLDPFYKELRQIDPVVYEFIQDSW